MSDFERAQQQAAQGPRVQEAAFVALREADCPLSAMEVRAIIEPTVGLEVEQIDWDTMGRCLRRYLPYGEVFCALKRLEARGAVTSMKVHNARIWSARG